MSEADLGQEIRKIFLENLQKTAPEILKDATKTSALKDSSTKALGYSKLLRKNYTP